RRGRGGLEEGGGQRVDPEGVPGGPDRDDRSAEAVRRDRDQRGGAAPGRDAGVGQDRRDQPRPEGGDLRDRGLRDRREPVRGGPGTHPSTEGAEGTRAHGGAGRRDDRVTVTERVPLAGPLVPSELS